MSMTPFLLSLSSLCSLLGHLQTAWEGETWHCPHCKGMWAERVQGCVLLLQPVGRNLFELWQS